MATSAKGFESEMNKRLENFVEIKCPHCGHETLIQKSVKIYTCLCERQYTIILVKNDPTETDGASNSEAGGTQESKEEIS